MNKLSLVDFRHSLLHHARLRVRLLDIHRRASVFSSGNEPDALPRIYVINLDRRPDRWHRVRREIDRFRDRHGQRLSAVTRRFSAVDARYLGSDTDAASLIPTFTLADQLAVDPHPSLRIDDATRAHKIEMTRQEVAVALSHIGVWKLIAQSDMSSALVLEDDVFMAYGFARGLQKTWISLAAPGQDQPRFDLLYLAFEEVGNVAPAEKGQDARGLRRPGIWEASGYVLSRDGARKLLERLPVCGPIDLWLNMQFGHLRAFTASRPLIEQRIDEPSTNSYSILPVLAQVGVITREKPLVPTAAQLPGPVVAVGDRDSGLTALATALSMLGYTCCSDLARLPLAAEHNLRHHGRDRLFNAYVNIGSLTDEVLMAVARANPEARFITTSPHQKLPDVPRERALCLPPSTKDRWAALSEFLEVDYPSFPYPNDKDLGLRSASEGRSMKGRRRTTDLEWDTGPWILKSSRAAWRGIAVEASPPSRIPTTTMDWAAGGTLDDAAWTLRHDTFPSNMALFTPANFSQHEGRALLTLQQEQTPVRGLTSAAIASNDLYLYGRFEAVLRPPNVRGLVTGLFLHRNGPRQEIDIEFLGKDTTKMLVNVFYNPGPENTKLEYGYRGTPTLIDLGFDAAADFHSYEIDWQPTAIRWRVDGRVVYERVMWDPTPIPDRPLQFNLNLWNSRSKQFAGSLATAQLPASATIRSVTIHTSTSPAVDDMQSARQRSGEVTS